MVTKILRPGIVFRKALDINVPQFRPLTSKIQLLLGRFRLQDYIWAYLMCIENFDSIRGLRNNTQPRPRILVPVVPFEIRAVIGLEVPIRYRRI